MIQVLLDIVLYGTILMSLLGIDYLLGNGFVFGLRKVLCKVACLCKGFANMNAGPTIYSTGQPEQPSIPVFLAELFVLVLTMMFLNRYKRYRGKDRIDELLQESKDALRQTNEFLEKWRLRRVPNEYSYLDEEPQQIKPLKLEVPILHMAIIDSRGANRQSERGDAGDTIKITDSTLLSVTSLLDDDLDESIPESLLSPEGEKIADEVKNVEFKNRFLWDVAEEDILLNSDD